MRRQVNIENVMYEYKLAEVLSIVLFLTFLLISCFFIFNEVYNDLIANTLFVAILFVFPFVLLKAKHQVIGITVLNIFLPLALIYSSIAVKSVLLEFQSLSQSNYYYIRIIFLATFLVPIATTPFRNFKLQIITLLPGIIVLLLLDPVHSLFGVGYEQVDSSHNGYLLFANVITPIAALIYSGGLMTLKRIVNGYVDSYKEIAADYFEFFETSPDALIIFSLEDLSILNVNKFSCQAYGYTQDQLIGSSYLNLVSTKHKKEVEQILISKEWAKPKIFIHTDRIGREIFVEFHAVQAHYNGKPAVFSYNKDVTSQIQRETNLMKAKRLAHFGFWEVDTITGNIEVSAQTKINLELPEQKRYDIEDLKNSVLQNDHLVIEQIFKNHTLDNQKISKVIRVISNEKSVKYIHMIAEEERNIEGEVTKIIGTTMDVTQFKETENFLTYLQESLNVVTWQYDRRNSEFRFSEGITNLLGAAHHKDKSFTFSDLKKILSKEDQKLIHNTFFEKVKSHSEFTITLCVSNNETPKYLLVSGKGLFNRIDELIEIRGLILDVTETKELELEVIKNERFLNMVFDSIPNLVYIKNSRDLKFTAVNKAFEELIGQSKTEIIGQNEDAIVDESLKSFFSKEDESLIKNNGEGIVFEDSIKLPKAQPRVFKTKKVPISPGKNKDSYILGISEDITDQKLNLEKVKHNEERLKIITETATNGTWEWDIEQKVFRWSKTATEFLGIDLEFILDSKVKDHLHPQDYPKHLAALRSSLVNKTAYSLELRIKNQKTGTYTWTQSNGRIITNSEGQPTKMLGIFIDIEHRKNSENLLLENQKLLEKINATIPNAVYIYDLESHEVLFSNNKTKEICGFTAEEMVSNSREDINKMCHPDDIDHVIQHYRNLSSDKFSEIIYRFKHKNGEWIWLENRDISFQTSPNGKTSQVLGIVSDVTERITYQNDMDAVNYELRLFRHALDLSALVAFADTNGIITYVNDKFATQFEYEKSELIGQNFNKLDSGYHADEFWKEMWSTVLGDNIWNGIIRDQSKSGKYIWLDTVIIPQKDQNNKIFRFLLVSHNVSDLKDAEESLASKNKELDEFVYIVSHDLKAPLRGINNLVHWIEEDSPETSPQVAHNIDLLKGRITRLDKFINGLLDYSRIGRQVLTLEPVNTFTLVKEVASMVAPSDKIARVTISETLPEIKSYRIFLTQVFNNLISNAIKHNDSDEKIVEINSFDEKGFIIFTVTDNGPGIPEFIGNKVFQIFQTAVSKDKKENTGIGLSIVSKIVSEMDGSIYFRNNKDKSGCTFFIKLPKS